MDVKDSDAARLWCKAMELVMREGFEYKDNEGRVCKELLNLQIMLENPSGASIERPITLINESKKWVYPSKEELANVIFKEVQAPVYDYTYGGRIFNFADRLDQLNNFIIPLLKKDINSRRATLIIYDPVTDSSVSNRNTPGIIYAQFRVRQGKLSLTAAIRSNDLFFGWPSNIFQLYSLQKYVAENLGKGVGDIVVFANSAHLFQDNFKHAEEVIGKVLS
jgi:thymidylate synthase (methanogen type)